MSEALEHPHMRARATFTEVGGVAQPAPAPRFSRSSPDAPSPPSHPGADTEAGLARWGVAAERIAALRAQGAIA